MESRIEAFWAIPLPSGEIVKVDPDDAPMLAQYSWCNSDGYSVAWVKGGANRAVLMHRLLIDDTPQVDHINGDGLDNRRSNLRSCTTSQNGMNRGKQKNNTSGYKGVGWHKVRGKWRAVITAKGKVQHLGHFDDPVEAAKAYDAAARKLHGEYARLNFNG